MIMKGGLMKKKECPSCAMEIDNAEKICPICGYEFPQQNPILKYAVIVLVIIFLLFIIGII